VSCYVIGLTVLAEIFYLPISFETCTCTKLEERVVIKLCKFMWVSGFIA